MTLLNLLDPKVDIVFQMLFASADDTAGLKSLLGALLAPEPIFSLEYFSPQRSATSVGGKKTRFDILVKVNGTTFVNLEMQKRGHPSQYGRSLYYWSVIFRDQLPSGVDSEYKDLMHTCSKQVMAPATALQMLFDGQLPDFIANVE